MPRVPAVRTGPLLLVDRPGSVQANLRFGGDAPSLSDPSYAAVQVADAIFTGLFSSRLIANLREDKGYTYGSYSTMRHQRAGSSLAVGVDVATDVAAPALVETVYELGRIVTLPPQPDEVEAAVQYLTGTAVLRTATQSGLADTLLHLLVRGQDVTWLRDHPARLAAVDPEQVHAAAAGVAGTRRDWSGRCSGTRTGSTLHWRRSPRSRRSTVRDRLGPMQGLKEAIDRTGYYPEVVADGVMRAVSGEDVVSFFVHHEPTFDRDEVRRHLTVVVLTPSRLILAHTDEHEGDDMLPEPYTSTSTEAISLSSVKSVVVTRMVTNPTGGPTPAAEAVLTIGWGGVARLDLEPATCGDPECDADHGYTGTLAADDFSIRVSAAADGPEAVPSLLAFAESLSARTQA